MLLLQLFVNWITTDLQHWQHTRHEYVYFCHIPSNRFITIKYNIHNSYTMDMSALPDIYLLARELKARRQMCIISDKARLTVV